MLNAISTGGNVIRGAVYGHTMINLTVSNNKLMQRSAEIVAQITGCGFANAHIALLRAVYDTDTVTDELMAMPASAHIEVFTLSHEPMVTTSTCIHARMLASIRKYASASFLQCTKFIRVHIWCVV